MADKTFCDICEKEITEHTSEHKKGWQVGDFHEDCLSVLRKDIEDALRPLETKYRHIGFGHFTSKLR